MKTLMIYGILFVITLCVYFYPIKPKPSDVVTIPKSDKKIYESGKIKCFDCLRETGGLDSANTQGTKCFDC